MELLIPGLILVALMVYASTRIKKTAALAFELEMIETDDFVIEKPEGFLSVISGNPELDFEAYSREFGEDDATEVKQARVEVRLLENTRLGDAVARIKKSSKVISNLSEVIGDRKYSLIEAERVENGVGMLDFYKLTEVGPAVRQLRIIALNETNIDIARKIEKIAASFLVK